MRLPTMLPLGASMVQLTPEKAITLDFLNGFQVGHLVYMTYIRPYTLTDADVTCVLFDQHLKHLLPYFQTGLLLGLCSTLLAKAEEFLPIDFTEEAFELGYDDGVTAWLCKQQQTIGLHELCSLVSRCCRGDNFYHAGYLVGYINALIVPACSQQEQIAFAADWLEVA